MNIFNNTLITISEDKELHLYNLNLKTLKASYKVDSVPNEEILVFKNLNKFATY
jgi:hypothetical protein